MQTLLLSDENGNIIGEGSIEECHTGQGKRHLAFVVAIFNKRGEILVQKRAMNKRFPLYWELPASHLFKNETLDYAIYRTLRRELGIEEKLDYKKIFEFNYFVRYNSSNIVENEHCLLFTCEYDGKIIPNYDEIYEYRFLYPVNVLKELKGEKISEWLRIPLEFLIKTR
ncbi:MAG: NUDIX domain-containing protein [Thermoproteota archaeon]|jgi:Isopentenyldiphosphate isomerase